MMPPDSSPPTEPEIAPAPVAVRAPVYHWYHKMSAIVFIAPWTDSWDGNYFSGILPELRAYWGNFYVRGAVSGLGVVNLYISLVEIFRLRRFTRR